MFEFLIIRPIILFLAYLFIVLLLAFYFLIIYIIDVTPRFPNVKISQLNQSFHTTECHISQKSQL